MRLPSRPSTMPPRDFAWRLHSTIWFRKNLFPDVQLRVMSSNRRRCFCCVRSNGGNCSRNQSGAESRPPELSLKNLLLHLFDSRKLMQRLPRQKVRVMYWQNENKGSKIGQRETLCKVWQVKIRATKHWNSLGIPGLERPLVLLPGEGSAQWFYSDSADLGTANNLDLKSVSNLMRQVRPTMSHVTTQWKHWRKKKRGMM